MEYISIRWEPGRADCVYEPDVRKPDYDSQLPAFSFIWRLDTALNRCC